MTNLIQRRARKKNLSIDKNLCFVILLSLFLFCNFLLPNDYLSIICTLGAGAYILTCDRKYLLPSLVYFSMFAYVFIVGHYATFIFVVLAFLIRAMIRNKKRLIVGIFLIPVYFILYFFSNDITILKLGDYVTFFIVISLFFMCNMYQGQDRKLIIQYFLAAHVISTVLGVFKGYTRFIQFMPLDYEGWGSEAYLRFSGLTYDPNFYTVNAVIALSILLLGHDYNIENPILWLASVLLTTIFGFLTYSKSCFICFAAIVILAFFLAPKMVKKRISYFIPLLLILIIIFWTDITNIFTTIIGRFNTEDGLDGVTTGRSELWGQYIKLIFSSPESFFVGSGLTPIYGLKAAHNTYIEIWYKFGLLGVVFHIVYFYYCYKQILGKHLKKNASNWLLVCLIVLLYFNLSAYSAYNFILSIFMLFILIKNKDKKKQ